MKHLALLLTLLLAVPTHGQVLLAVAPPDYYPSGYQQWLEDALLTADYHGGRWVDGSVYNADLDSAILYGQYEPWYGFRRLAEHVGPGAAADALETYAVASGDAWRVYSSTNSGSIPGYYNYTSGFAKDWVLNADADSRDAVIEQSASAAYASDAASIANLKDQDFSRECAYAMMSYINAEVYCAQSHRSRMEALRDLILGDVDDVVSHNAVNVTLDEGGHIEQWLGTYTTDANGDYVSGSHAFANGSQIVGEDYEQGYAAFMGALSAYSLIKDYELSASINGGVAPDDRTIAKLVRLADATWNEYWVEGDASMKYRWRDGATGDLITTGSPALNNEMFPWYAWLYYRTGDIRHKQRAEKLFNGTQQVASFTYRGVATQTYLSKEYNEIIRWAVDGLDWYRAGVLAHE